MIDNDKLRQFITTSFNDPELDELCFDYYRPVKDEFTIGMTKSQKVMALIDYCKSRGILAHLLVTLGELRPTFPEQFDLVPTQQVGDQTTVRDSNRIFVSYANQDAAFARRLADDLHRNGFDVWMAPESIEPGEKWVDAIERGLETSGIFVLVITPHAANSKWVRDESNYAIAQQNEGKMRFFTLYVAEATLPPMWSVRQHIPFRGDYDEGLRQLLAALRPERFTARLATPTLRTPPTSAMEPSARKSLYWALGIVALLAAALLVWQWMANSRGVEYRNEVAGAIRPIERGGVDVEQVFVPAGSFMMGSEAGASDEQPVHEVTLDAFWIDRTEVTNAQFELFVSETGFQTTAEQEGGGYIYTNNGWSYTEGADWRHPQGPSSNLNGLGQHPVVLVSWDDATAFCAWAGGRLPSEAEWEYAARGPDSLVYPWGDVFDGTRLNYCDRNCPFDWADQAVDDGYEFTAPAETYSSGASWIGALDMTGNVWEWVNDWYESGYYGKSPDVNPSGPASGEHKVLRGGAWSDYYDDARASYRIDFRPVDRLNFVGFRCAQE